MAKRHMVRSGKEPWFRLLPGSGAAEVAGKTRKHLSGISGVRGVIIEEVIRVVTVVSPHGLSIESNRKVHDAECNIMNGFSLRPIEFDFAIERVTPNIWKRHRNGRHVIVRFNHPSKRHAQARAK